MPVKTTTVKLDCVDVTVRVRDHNDKPLAGYEAQIRLHDRGAITGKEPLAMPNAEHTFHVRQINWASYVDLFGPNNYSTMTRADLTKGGVYVFKFMKCSKKISPP